MEAEDDNMNGSGTESDGDSGEAKFSDENVGEVGIESQKKGKPDAKPKAKPPKPAKAAAPDSEDEAEPKSDAEKESKRKPASKKRKMADLDFVSCVAKAYKPLMREVQTHFDKFNKGGDTEEAVAAGIHGLMTWLQWPILLSQEHLQDVSGEVVRATKRIKLTHGDDDEEEEGGAVVKKGSQKGKGNREKKEIKRPRYTEEEEAEIDRLLRERMSIDQIANFLGRTPDSIKAHLKSMKKNGTKAERRARKERERLLPKAGKVRLKVAQGEVKTDMSDRLLDTPMAESSDGAYDSQPQMPLGSDHETQEYDSNLDATENSEKGEEEEDKGQKEIGSGLPLSDDD